MKEDDSEEDICLDGSFFVNRDYELTTFTFGTSVLELFCLRSSSTDYDLTGQIVWPGAVLLNNYLSGNPKMLEGLSVIELGSGVGVTGILCSKFCSEVLLTDHNDEVLEILKKNIELESSSGNQISTGLNVEKLEWGNYDHIERISQKYYKGMDEMVVDEAVRLGMEVNEVAGTRSVVSSLEGVIYEITLPL